MTNIYLTKALEILNETKQSLEEKDWVFVLENDGTLLEKKEFPEICPTPRYKLNSIIDKNTQDLINKIWCADYDSSKRDDCDIIDWEIVESGDDCKVIRQTNKMPWPIWTRESVVAQVKIVDDNITWIISYSIDHELVPIDEANYVRTGVYMSVYGFENCENATKVYKVVQINPAGSIPVSVVNMYAGKLANAVNKWKLE